MSKIIINKNEVARITVSIDERNPNEIITNILLKGENLHEQINIPGDQSKHEDIIELTILNSFNENQFLSITKLATQINDRIKVAEKKNDEYKERGE